MIDREAIARLREKLEAVEQAEAGLVAAQVALHNEMHRQAPKELPTIPGSTFHVAPNGVAHEVETERKRKRNERDQARRDAKRDAKANVGTDAWKESLRKQEEDKGTLVWKDSGPVMTSVAELNAAPPPPPARPTSLKDHRLAEPVPDPNDDLDAELLYALRTPQPDATRNGEPFGVPNWDLMIEKGANDTQIGIELQRIWPDHVLMQQRGFGRTGYSVQGGKASRFWLGGYQGPKHRPDLAGAPLVARVRSLLEIPRPHQAKRIAAAPKGALPPVDTPYGGLVIRKPQLPPPSAKKSEPPTAIPEPAEGWDSATFANAVEDLEVGVDNLLVCSGCNALLPAGRTCLKCGPRGGRAATTVLRRFRAEAVTK